MNSYDEYFKYNGSQLVCEGVPLAELARRYGTPLYVYTERGFRTKYREIDGALDGVDHLICYSIKSNSNIHILDIMREMGSGMDVVSGGEIYRALKAGIAPERIVYAGVGKSEDEIAYALDAGILMFNCESFPEIEAIDAVARGKGQTADIAVRVNPDVEANTHHYITTGKKENKFGIGIDALKRSSRTILERRGVRLRGVHAHIGSQILEVAPFVHAMDKLIGLALELKASGFTELDYVNLGGGFGIRYRDEEFFPVDEWAREIKKRIARTGLKLIVEPGRYLSGNNGVLLVKVLYRKTAEEKTFIVTDGAMNDLIRPSLYGAYQEILNCTRREGTELVDVVGPICESGDFFAKDRVMGVSEQNDFLAVMSAGAYGMAMASHYNSRRLPAEVLVAADGSHRLIRNRESYDDMVRAELAGNLIDK